MKTSELYPYSYLIMIEDNNGVNPEYKYYGCTLNRESAKWLAEYLGSICGSGQSVKIVPFINMIYYNKHDKNSKIPSFKAVVEHKE